MSEQDNKKIYIVQFRTDASEAHDQSCYNEELGEYSSQFVFLNAVKGTLPTEIPEDMAGVIMGGSGEFFLTKDDPEKVEWIKKTMEFIDLLIEKDIPLFGVCYGAHLLALNRGSDITLDEKLSEVGTFDVELLPDAKDDPFFSKLPEHFEGQFGHKSTPINFPKKLIPLARTERVSVQAFRVQGKPAWGLMFHPELNRERMKVRIGLFPNYVPKGMAMEDLLKDFHDTPEASQLLHMFADYIMKKNV